MGLNFRKGKEQTSGSGWPCKNNDKNTPPSHHNTFVGPKLLLPPIGGDDPNSNAGGFGTDTKMKKFVKLLKGNQLEGAMPEPFKGDRSDTK